MRKRRWKVCKRQRIQEFKQFTVKSRTQVASKDLLTEAHQPDCLNVSWIRTTIIDMPKWRGESPYKASTRHEELQATKGCKKG